MCDTDKNVYADLGVHQFGFFLNIMVVQPELLDFYFEVKRNHEFQL